MGAIRLILALSVMIHHGARFSETGTLRLVAADMAVWLFFIMSGFVMTLTLEKNYLGQANGVPRFYINRALRLYPMYLVLLALCLLALRYDDVYLSKVTYFTGFPALDDPSLGFWPWRLLLDVSQIGIVGTDVVHMVMQGNNAHHFDPPVWSLAVEITFYALAPFLVAVLHRFRYALIAAVVAATAAWATRLGYLPHLWGPFALFPNTLWLFLFGIVAYRGFALLMSRGYEHALRKVGLVVFGSILFYVFGCLLTIGYLPPFYAPRDTNDARILIQYAHIAWLPAYVAFALLLPPLFVASQNPLIRRADYALGELAYPVFIAHWPITYFLFPEIRHLVQRDYGMVIPTYYSGAAILIGSLAIYLAIEAPLQRTRAWLRRPPSVNPQLAPVRLATPQPGYELAPIVVGATPKQVGLNNNLPA
jgi:peptidoglycan/LPS O-acetylase OafA/YrhL